MGPAAIGVVAWALLSIAGISALVAASEIAFLVLKLVGACVLVWLGIQSLRRARSGELPPPPPRTRAFRDGLANPKLAVLASRARAGFMRSRAGRWLERVTGSALIALGLRVARTGRHAGL
jgi:threonine/homoserine/homoserine lactone efflux protein